jgi:hypothetical protein
MSSGNPSSLDDPVTKVADMTASDHSESSAAGANSASDKKAGPIELTGADSVPEQEEIAAVEQEETAAVEQEETAAVEQKNPGDVEEKTDPVVKQNSAEETTDVALEPKGVSVEAKKAVNPAKIEQAKARYARNRENIKFDPSLLPESDDPEEIRKQVSLLHNPPRFCGSVVTAGCRSSFTFPIQIFHSTNFSLGWLGRTIAQLHLSSYALSRGCSVSATRTLS